MTAPTPWFVVALVLALSVVLAVGLATPSGAAADPWTRSGAILRPSDDDRVKVVSPFQSCDVMLEADDGQCGVLTTANGQLAFTVEPATPADDVLVSKPWVVRVYSESSEPDHANEFVVGLATRPQGDEVGPLFAHVQAVVGDVTGDGKPEVFIGYLSEGTGQVLDIDIVTTARNGAPKVLGHEQLFKGVAEVQTGRIVVWTPVYRKADGNCCPTWIRRDVVRYRGGEFEIERGTKVRTAKANVPPGDFSETHDSTG